MEQVIVKQVLIAASIVTALSLAGGAHAEVRGLDQNWSATDLSAWQDESQGSRLIPLSWFMALEKADTKERFLTDANVLRFGYPPRDLVFDHYTYRLPRGFVVDVTDDDQLTFSRLRWKAAQTSREPWVGMNCSACHTATIAYQGHTFEVQGGPTNADFQSFLEVFRLALVETRASEEKFDRFASRVLGSDNSAANKDMLLKSLDRLNQFLATSASLNSTDLRYGPGRVDAVGHILNRIAQLNGATAPTPNPSDAPVSYPFLWNVPQHSKVQWNGIAPNFRVLGKQGLDIGALARNTSEVIGVFADVKFVQNSMPGGYSSSVNVNNLYLFEKTLEKLKPPRWPEQLPPIEKCNDPTNPNKCLVTRGADLFKANCSKCHVHLPRDDLKTPIDAKMSRIVDVEVSAETSKSIGTDPWMACNTYQFKSDPGLLEGARLNALIGSVTKGDNLATQLGVTARKVLLNKGTDVVALAASGFFNVEQPGKLTPILAVQKKMTTYAYVTQLFKTSKQLRLEQCYGEASNVEILAYKARPLTGIWATAPYLHNGSVPTLYDLLLPPNQRPKSFYTGSTNFDPKKVGFITDKDAVNQFPYDTSLSGNLNSGHDYGAASFNDDDRWALIEYMKTL